ncbi:MAG: hypothetical protein P8X55_06515 [Desulfosarcinaceae bacterium]
MQRFEQSAAPDREKALIEINRRLGSTPIPHLINETFIADLHRTLATCQDFGGGYFWLLYARLSEAALLCAGHYADNCEYAAAGDLLVNPRCIRLYDRACPTICRTKDRHSALSEQFKPDGMPDHTFRQQFREGAALDIEEPALLPLLAETMRDAGVFHSSYLDSVTQRMQKIADTISFLLTWPVDDVRQIEKHLVSASAESADFVMSNLCRFDCTIFDDLGAELHAIESSRFTSSAFLNSRGAGQTHSFYEVSDNDRTFSDHERPQAFF